MDKRHQDNQALQALHPELAEMKLALEHNAIVSTSDHTGKINYVNDKFCEISQYSREQLLGANHRLINSGYHSADFFKQMWAPLLVVRSGKEKSGTALKMAAFTGWIQR